MSYTNQDDSIEVRTENGLIVFDGYQQYKQKAMEARDYLLSLDVKPESEQECKKIVASARKISDKLNQEKIRIKRQVMEPYTQFESQVKEIIGIITEGEDAARDKLREIEAQRQEEKKSAIRKIWDARCGSFESGRYLHFEDFLKPSHLNRTTLISNVEKEMVQFFKETSADIKYLQQFPMSDEYIEEYIGCQNLTLAVNTVNSRHQAVKEVAREPYIVIKVSGKAGVILAKQLLKDIDYEIVEEK